MYDFRQRNRNYPGFNEYYDRQLIWNAGAFSEIQILVKDYRLGMQTCNALVLGKGGVLGLNSSFAAFLGYRQYMLNYQLAASSHAAYYHNVGVIFKFR